MTRSCLPTILFVAHLGALIFGLVGILIMLPHPELWQDDPSAVEVFTWSMEHAGATHIILGAATMFAFGIVAIGWRKTAIFAAVSYPLSLGSELIGTGTGWPFGNYEYTDFLGTKVLGRVPYTIPLSWFYMGFASFLLGGDPGRPAQPDAQYAVATIALGDMVPDGVGPGARPGDGPRFATGTVLDLG